eukprot:TRINITY_DN4350_c0_g1_i4.p1 TRINITY_DN4350_c0_g1~~TRINITY_DN4350_c0_g1_i4.p1  ORF type:complete len:116 (-),score=25.87 TRINITY_DN4350_c0_g1_i4:77-424(-)
MTSMKLQLDDANREREVLKELLAKAPKNPSAVDFAVLERKIQTLELELRQRGQGDGGKHVEMVVKELKKKHETEKKQLLEVIEVKNREIKQFRIELESLLGELEVLRSLSAARGS